MSTKATKILMTVISIALICCVVFLLIFKLNVNNNYKINNSIIDSVIDEKNANEVDWDKLKKKNNDIVGWLSINNTTINTPIVQSSDNSFYLKKNINKEYSFSGTPFMDYRNSNDLTDNNTIIYGHNMRDYQLFGELLTLYKDSSSASNNKFIKLNTPNGTHKYVIVGAFYTNSNPSDDNGYVSEYNIPNLDEGNFSDFLAQLKQRYIFTSGIEVNNTDKIITLSTCAYQFRDERFVVIARELRENESENTFKFNFKKNENPRYPDKWYKINHKNNLYENMQKWSLDEENN